MIELREEDLIDKSTYTFGVFDQISRDREKYWALYQREKDIDLTLWSYLHSNHTISDEDYRRFISWCHHSNEDVSKIGAAILGHNDKIILKQN